MFYSPYIGTSNRKMGYHLVSVVSKTLVDFVFKAINASDIIQVGGYRHPNISFSKYDSFWHISFGQVISVLSEIYLYIKSRLQESDPRLADLIPALA